MLPWQPGRTFFFPPFPLCYVLLSQKQQRLVHLKFVRSNNLVLNTLFCLLIVMQSNSKKKSQRQANQGVKVFVFVNRLCQDREESKCKKWIDRGSGEEINIMSDISKSNMHESTMPPIAQQTNS